METSTHADHESSNPTTSAPALSRTTRSAWRVTWDNLSDLARLPGVADLYDTRFFLLVPTTNGEQVAHVGDTLALHPDGKFSVPNA